MSGGRRHFLARSLAAAAAIPLLETTGVRAQPATGAPRRLIIFYTPNGTIGSEWRPKGSETTFTLGRILRPLETHRSKLLVLGGVNMALADSGYGSHHARGVGGLLTGRPILQGNFAVFAGNRAGWAGGISIDQHIAKSIAPTTRFKTLELGVRILDSEVRGRISYLGASQPVPPIESPYDVFDRLFAGVPAPAAPGTPAMTQADRIRLEKRSVLDFLKEELTVARTRAGVGDRAKLDLHLDSIRDIERRLGTAGPAGTPPPVAAAGCQAPVLGARIDVAATDNIPAVGKLQMDVLAAALACDVTRIATLQWTHPEVDQTFPWLGVSQGHHATSHAGDSDSAAQEALTKVNVWYAEQLRYLADKLASYREGDRTLLDNTVILWCNEIGKGNNHAHRDLPFALLGSAGGYFRTGRFVDYMAGGASGHPHNNLLLSLGQAMGIKDTSFGDPQHCTGPLPGLT